MFSSILGETVPRCLNFSAISVRQAIQSNLFNSLRVSLYHYVVARVEAEAGSPEVANTVLRYLLGRAMSFRDEHELASTVGFEALRMFGSKKIFG